MLVCLSCHCSQRTLNTFADNAHNLQFLTLAPLLLAWIPYILTLPGVLVDSMCEQYWPTKEISRAILPSQPGLPPPPLELIDLVSCHSSMFENSATICYYPSWKRLLALI